MIKCKLAAMFFSSIQSKSVFRISLLLSLGLMVSLPSASQQPGGSYSRQILSDSEKKLAEWSTREHSQIQPLAHGIEKKLECALDSTACAADSSEKFSFHIKPFGSLQGGFQFSPAVKPLGTIVAGGMADFTFQNNLYIQAGYSLVGNKAADYISSVSDRYRIIPGAGYGVRDAKDVYHSHYSFGRICYTAGKYFNFEAGKGKHFWGDGYRSMILSDNSNSYPYLRITTKIWNLKYTNLWAQLKDLSSNQGLTDARKKYIALHALSWNVNREINFTLYEMVVWQDRDSNSRRTLDMNYLNPIIFYRPVEYAQGSADNVILAFSTRVKITKKFTAYAQFVLDEFLLNQLKQQLKWWGNKLGGQVGIKAFDVLTPGLHFQTEINIARPFLFTHGSPIQGWSNMNQPLAHPLGANFFESTSFIKYKLGKWSIREQFNFARFGKDKDVDGDGKLDNLGGDVLRSYRNPFRQYGNLTLQGNQHTLFFNEIMVSREIPGLQQFEFFGSFSTRFVHNESGNQNDTYFMFGVRSRGLMEMIRDF
jgi:hypothetical protein